MRPQERNRIKRELDRIFNAFDNDDQTLKYLIVIHTHTERHIDKLLSQHFIHKHKVIRRLSFSLKLQLLYGIGALDEWLYENLITLNDVRNHYAHTPDATFSNYKKDRQPFLRSPENFSINLMALDSPDEERVLVELFNLTLEKLIHLEGVTLTP